MRRDRVSRCKSQRTQRNGRVQSLPNEGSARDVVCAPCSSLKLVWSWDILVEVVPVQSVSAKEERGTALER